MNLPKLKDGFYWRFDNVWPGLLEVRCFGKRRYWFDRPMFVATGWTVAQVTRDATELAEFIGVTA